MPESNDTSGVGKNKIWSRLRGKWLVATPEERVRQAYLEILTDEYGFPLEAIAEEIELTGRGSGGARADFVVWKTREDKAKKKTPLVVVECKSDNVRISTADYHQGEFYARMSGAPFFVTHNSRETKYWRVLTDRLPGYTEEIENIPHADSSDEQVQELLKKLKVFSEHEFANVLASCHDVIRNREAKDPAAAFDEIAKILFTKVHVEKHLRKTKSNSFTVEVLNQQISENPLDVLFQQTKKAYTSENLFSDDDRIQLKKATSEEIVRKLERYNLSDTDSDIKGVAFEKFLGRTFRGEIGQFFTPRTVVDFMVRLADPEVGEVIIDPASGSGGFLIRSFSYVRDRIVREADQEYRSIKKDIDASDLSDEDKLSRLNFEYERLQEELDEGVQDSRLWRLANRSLYGTDASERMARTSKMNMIMHGEGQRGIFHGNGLVDIGDIFEGRFDVVLTNPPFGSTVSVTEVLEREDVERSPEEVAAFLADYGQPYQDSWERLQSNQGSPILDFYELPRSKKSTTKTEILFIERVVNLLKPGGRAFIVLPEGIFNNPSLRYVRDFVEERSFVRSIISLPQSTFVSSKAMVKCSILHIQKFTNKQAAQYDEVKLRSEVAASQQMDLSPNERRSFSRELLRKEFNYPVFMFDARHVGITATGEADINELFTAEGDSGNETALSMYKQFVRDNQDARWAS